MADKKCPHCRTKERSEEEIKDLITRLNRIEGSLNSFSKVLLGNHIRTCVAEDIRNGSEEKTEELVELLQKLMK